MEVKTWTYEDFPAFDEAIGDVEVLTTDGDQILAKYIPDVEYAVVDGIPLHLQILVPESRNLKIMKEEHRDKDLRWPCVVFTQGSAWMKQDVYAKIPSVANLCERGYVCAIVEYRHSGQAAFPAQIEDALNAIRFMKVHADDYHIDVNRMISAGDSSGGHTAMFTGILNTDDTRANLFPGVSADVKGIINYYGSCSVMADDSNPMTVTHCLPESPEGMVMGRTNLREREDLRRALSVECNIDEDTNIPPVLIFHGTKDRTVNTTCSTILYRALKECGKDVTLYLLDGADHGGPEFWSEAVIDLADKFMKRVFENA